MANAWLDTCWGIGAWEEGSWEASADVDLILKEPEIISTTIKLTLRDRSIKLKIRAY